MQFTIVAVVFTAMLAMVNAIPYNVYKQDKVYVLEGIAGDVHFHIDNVRSHALNITDSDCQSDIITPLAKAISILNSEGPNYDFFLALDDVIAASGNVSSAADFRNASIVAKSSIGHLVTAAFNESTEETTSTSAGISTYSTSVSFVMVSGLVLASIMW